MRSGGHFTTDNLGDLDPLEVSNGAATATGIVGAAPTIIPCTPIGGCIPNLADNEGVDAALLWLAVTGEWPEGFHDSAAQLANRADRSAPSFDAFHSSNVEQS